MGVQVGLAGALCVRRSSYPGVGTVLEALWAGFGAWWVSVWVASGAIKAVRVGPVPGGRMDGGGSTVQGAGGGGGV